jgi:hypothetical protein
MQLQSKENAGLDGRVFGKNESVCGGSVKTAVLTPVTSSFMFDTLHI